jgi:hypothetical protein
MYKKGCVEDITGGFEKMQKVRNHKPQTTRTLMRIKGVGAKMLIMIITGKFYKILFKGLNIMCRSRMPETSFARKLWLNG